MVVYIRLTGIVILRINNNLSKVNNSLEKVARHGPPNHNINLTRHRLNPVKLNKI